MIVERTNERTSISRDSTVCVARSLFARLLCYRSGRPLRLLEQRDPVVGRRRRARKHLSVGRSGGRSINRHPIPIHCRVGDDTLRKS